MWVSEAALDWAIGQLQTWANSETPNTRFKQTLYRLLLLKQLGVNELSHTSLTSTGFVEHCRKYLLVSSNTDVEKTDGKDRYLVPFTLEYQIASPGSDWAIGTMWTRLDSRDVKSYLAPTARDGPNTAKFKFLPGYHTYFESKLEENPIPALPLALFLLRGVKLDIAVTASATDMAAALLEKFKDEFHLQPLHQNARIFDWSLPNLP